MKACFYLREYGLVEESPESGVLNYSNKKPPPEHPFALAVATCGCRCFPVLFLKYILLASHNPEKWEAASFRFEEVRDLQAGLHAVLFMQ
ncbi:hypothetical protein [Pontibacter beigongshangensis]|uniref:hypothetical protein n=1 Tax=Pontibacter beigongshangensis TaxID=2574733 RepID=UPI001650CB5C|nr:hypothetical protein [Pontibacter beigongshangensis]